MPSQTNGITVRESPQPEFCNTIRLRADIRTTYRCVRLGPQELACRWPFSGIHEEIEAGKLSAALLPRMRADRVLALPRGRPVSRATREVLTGLMRVCQDLVDEGKILVAKPRKTSR